MQDVRTLRELYLNIQSVPRSKHSISLLWKPAVNAV